MKNKLTRITLLFQPTANRCSWRARYVFL